MKISEIHFDYRYQQRRPGNILLIVGFTVLLVASCGVVESQEDSTTQPTDHVKVYKYDGSTQCENAGIGLDVMAQKLVGAGIEVNCSQKGHDGLGRPAVCGESTGNLNVYEIDASKLADAEALGFAPVTELSEYPDQKCE